MSEVRTTTGVFCKKNLSSLDLIESGAPWDINKPLPHLETKQSYRAWCTNPTTDNVFFSLIEGKIAQMPTGPENKAHRVHGFVADYDTSGLTEEDFPRMLKRCNPRFQPYAWNTTFSGGARVVWLFEEPIFYYDADLYKKFVTRLKRELKLTSLFAGFDESCEQAGRYYTAGDGWTINPHKPQIKSHILHTWQLETSRPSDFQGGVEIPLEIVAEEVEKQFPGRWNGEFKEGSRGVRFWDPTGDALSAIVRKTGMQAFTGPDGFLSWERIFGRAFVQAYLEDRLGAAIRDMFYDGKNFYRELPDESWDAMGMDTTRRHLAVRYRLSTRVGKEENESECDRAMHRIETSKRISGALPFPHNHNKIVTFDGNRYLNTATATTWPASLDPQEWGENFPWIANYLSVLFDSTEGLVMFLSWLHVWMKSIHAGTPRKGHALFLIGPPGTGKTFLSTQILGRMAGGSAEATRYIVEGNQFNDALFQRALWTIDDAIPGSDAKSHAKFSAMVKAIVANGTFRYEKKYGGSHDVPSNARLVTTLNDDPNSLSCLPDTDMSLLDKIFLLRTGDIPAEMAYEPAERYATVERELSAFVRWVLDYDPPEWVERDPRFGIKAFHEAGILQEAREVTASSTLLDVIQLWRREYARTHEDQESWSGTPTELLALLRSYEATSSVSSRFSPVWVGRHVNQAIANGVSWLSRVRRSAKESMHVVIKLNQENE